MTLQELRQHAQTMDGEDRDVMMEALDLIDAHDKERGKREDAQTTQSSEQGLLGKEQPDE
jgi:hypothetical protein